MVKNCCVLSCHNNRTTHPNLSFYIIPSDTSDLQKRQLWIESIAGFHAELFREVGGPLQTNKPWAPTSDYTYVCSDHFVDGRRYDEISNVDYVPTVFPRRLDQEHRTIAKVERYLRAAVGKPLKIEGENYLSSLSQSPVAIMPTSSITSDGTPCRKVVRFSEWDAFVDRVMRCGHYVDSGETSTGQLQEEKGVYFVRGRSLFLQRPGRQPEEIAYRGNKDTIGALLQERQATLVSTGTGGDDGMGDDESKGDVTEADTSRVEVSMAGVIQRDPTNREARAGKDASKNDENEKAIKGKDEKNDVQINDSEEDSSANSSDDDMGSSAISKRSEDHPLPPSPNSSPSSPSSSSLHSSDYEFVLDENEGGFVKTKKRKAESPVIITVHSEKKDRRPIGDRGREETESESEEEFSQSSSTNVITIGGTSVGQLHGMSGTFWPTTGTVRPTVPPVAPGNLIIRGTGMANATRLPCRTVVISAEDFLARINNKSTSGPVGHLPRAPAGSGAISASPLPRPKSFVKGSTGTPRIRQLHNQNPSSLKQILPRPLPTILQRASPQEQPVGGKMVSIWDKQKSGEIAIVGYVPQAMYQRQPTNTKSVASSSQAGAASLENETVAADVPKVFRPAAWLLHGIGKRLVREQVYKDLIEVQTTASEHRKLDQAEIEQLERLRAARDAVAPQNDYLRGPGGGPGPRRKCQCGVGADTLLELEVHKDYGHNTEIGRSDCCLCGMACKYPSVFMTHMSTVHGRRARVHLPLATFLCPYCPFEHRHNTKVKMGRHIENCQRTFVLNQNLALSAIDCDFPLYGVPPPRPPPAKISVVKVTPTKVVTSTSKQTSSPSSLTILTTITSTGLITTVAAPKQPPVTSVTKPSPVTSASKYTPISAVTTKSPETKTLTATTSSSKTKIIYEQLPMTKAMTAAQEVEASARSLGVCEICGAFTRSQASLALHLAQAHGAYVAPAFFRSDRKPPLPCSMANSRECNERFWTVAGVASHVARCHGTNKKEDVVEDMPAVTKCPICCRTRVTDIIAHLASFHRITMTDMFAQRYCAMCLHDASTEKSFEDHMLSGLHHKMFPNRSALLENVMSATDNTRGFTFSGAFNRQSTQLISLVRKHRMTNDSSLKSLTVDNGSNMGGGEKKMKPSFSCPTCHCVFDSVKAHAFKCSQCENRHSSAEFLDRHYLLVHGSEVERCQLCKEMVPIGSEYVKHFEEKHAKLITIPVDKVCNDLTAPGVTSDTSNNDKENMTIDDDEEEEGESAIKIWGKPPVSLSEGGDNKECQASVSESDRDAVISLKRPRYEEEAADDDDDDNEILSDEDISGLSEDISNVADTSKDDLGDYDDDDDYNDEFEPSAKRMKTP